MLLAQWFITSRLLGQSRIDLFPLFPAYQRTCLSNPDGKFVRHCNECTMSVYIVHRGGYGVVCGMIFVHFFVCCNSLTCLNTISLVIGLILLLCFVEFGEMCSYNCGLLCKATTRMH